MKRKICYIIVSLCVIVVVLLSAFLISWIVATNRSIDYSNTWLSITISESPFENDISDVSNVDTISHKSINYGLYKVATKIECIYTDDDTSIEFFVIQSTKGINLSNVDFDALIEKRSDIVGREIYICVGSKKAEDMELILNALALKIS